MRGRGAKLPLRAVTLTLPSPIKGRGFDGWDLGLVFGWLSCPRFREDDVVGQLWIPAFAGMTAGGYREGIRWLGFGLGFLSLSWSPNSGFPPSRE